MAKSKPRTGYRPMRGRGSLFSLATRRVLARYARKRQTPMYRNPFPKKLKGKLKYSYYTNLTSTTTNVDYNVFRMSSLYDPDYTGVGNQPRYFDQVASANLYRRYRVDSVDYKITFVNKSTTSDACVGLFFRSEATPTPTTNAELFLSSELGSTTIKTLMPIGSPNCKITMKGTRKVWPLVAPSERSYKDDRQYSGAYNGNPSAEAYIHAMVGDNPQGAGGSDVDLYVELVFNIEFFELANDIAQS